MWVAVGLLLTQVYVSLGDYCTGGPTTIDDANLGPVFLAGDSQTIDDELDCPGSRGVIDLTSLVADLAINTEYGLRYEITTCGIAYRRAASVWIDWDADGVFQASDLIHEVVITSNRAPQHVSFTLPPTFAVGQTVRMRIMVEESGDLPLDPCKVFVYGAVKDFSIFLSSVAPPPTPPRPPSPPSFCMDGGPTSVDDSNLGAVMLHGNDRSIADESNCPARTGVVDHTAMVADVDAGGEYTLRYRITTCGLAYARSATAWIDWDNDGRFEDVDAIDVVELVTGEDIERTARFTIPDGIPTGTLLRMRVMVREAAQLPLDSCASFSWGGVKDFSILIASTKMTNSTFVK